MVDLFPCHLLVAVIHVASARKVFWSLGRSLAEPLCRWFASSLRGFHFECPIQQKQKKNETGTTGDQSFRFF